MYHEPVMLEECLEGLQVVPEGTYVDVTFGGGGHTRAILDRLTSGRLIAFDQDEDARIEAEKIEGRSFTFCQANFRYLKRYLKHLGATQVNGILADLGISSHQIDSPVRGFSTRFEGPLDMRMDVKSDLTAAGVLNEYPEEKLHKLFGMYGELRNARTIAREACQRRKTRRFGTTRDFLDLLRDYAPRGKENKYFAQAFQALRIEVNGELAALEEFLTQCADVIAKDGRLVVMSYHSLEDKMIKNYIQTGKVFGTIDKDFFGNPIRPFAAVNRKPIEASDEEVARNNRARSARLRIAQRI